MKVVTFTIVSVGLALNISTHSGLVLAGDAALGKERTQVCANCHGVDGRGTNPGNPNLAGQKKNYLTKALKDFRDGKRKHSIMNSMAKGLSDSDIDNITEYYSGLK